MTRRYPSLAISASRPSRTSVAWSTCPGTLGILSRKASDRLSLRIIAATATTSFGTGGAVGKTASRLAWTSVANCLHSDQCGSLPFSPFAAPSRALALAFKSATRERTTFLKSAVRFCSSRFARRCSMTAITSAVTRATAPMTVETKSNHSDRVKLENQARTFCISATMTWLPLVREGCA